MTSPAARNSLPVRVAVALVTAYQGAARGVAADMVRTLNTIASGGLTPMLTLLLDLPEETSVGRARERALKAGAKPDRFEREALGFHKAVRQGYLELAAREPTRFRVLNGDRPVEEVEKDVLEIVLAGIGP